MTLASQMVGKKVKGELNGLLAEGQIVGAVEVTQSTNVAMALGVLTKQIKGSKGSVLIMAVKV